MENNAMRVTVEIGEVGSDFMFVPCTSRSELFQAIGWDFFNKNEEEVLGYLGTTAKRAFMGIKYGEAYGSENDVNI